MRFAALTVLLSAQTLCAGLQKYSELVVADAASTTTTHAGIRVTYLGTNGFEFRAGNHALVVDPYFSRFNFSRIAFNSKIQPDLQRIDEAMKHLAPRIDAILVTHGHFDHLMDAPVVMQETGARLIASRTAVQVAEHAGAPAVRCDAVTAGNNRQIGPWKIQVLPATHDRLFWRVPFPGEVSGNGSPHRASDWVCGEPLAYLIEIHATRIYIDCGGTPSMLPPANVGGVDLAIIGVALRDSRERFSATVQRLRPRYILPSHQDNFFRPLSAGFQFGPLTDFSRVRRDFERQNRGRLIMMDYFRPWTLPRK